MIVSDTGGNADFKQVPAGTHLARCYRLVDLGTQKQEWQGQTKSLRKVMVSFEIHGDDDDANPIVMDDGKPMSISKNYTFSLAEKATLRADLVSWRGRAFTDEELRKFELETILGAWAMISVVHAPGNNGKVYSNIVNINGVPPVIRKNGLPKGFNEVSVFSFDNPDMQVFEKLSKGIKAKIEASPEWKQLSKAPHAPAGSGFDDMESDVPF